MQILNRRRVNKRLKLMLEKKLLVLQAPMGYGKTTAVREFLSRQRNVDSIWISFEGIRDEEWLWQQIAAKIHKKNKALGELILNQHMPRSREEVSQFAELLRLYLNKPLIFIADDCKWDENQGMERLLQYLVLEKTEFLHIVILCRQTPNHVIQEMYSKNQCTLLYKEELEFSKEEINELFEFNQVKLTRHDLNQIYTYTQGWISAVALAFSLYRNKKTQIGSHIFYDLIHLVYDETFTEEEKEVLSKISYLDDFTVDQMNYITRYRYGSKLIRKLGRDTGFLQHNEQGNTEQFLIPFHSFLKDEAMARRIDEVRVYQKNGDYNWKLGRKIEAIAAYHKARNYKKILHIIEYCRDDNFLDMDADLIVQCFSSIPHEMLIQHPYAYLRYINDYISDIDPFAGAKKLYELKAELEEMDCLPRHLRGEFALSEAFLEYNDVRKMNEYFMKAYELFNGDTSRISNPNMLATFGSFHTLYLYHTKSGDLKDLADLLRTDTKYYIYISNGVNKGFDMQSQAEYAFETGEYDRVEAFAEQAYYKAETKNQKCIMVAALFQLGRLAIMSGNVEQFNNSITALEKELEATNIPTLKSEIDCALSYLYAVTCQKDKVVTWIQHGNLKECHLLHECEGISSLVYGEYLLICGDSIQLEALAQELIRQYQQQPHVFGSLLAYLYDAIAKLDVSREQARESFQKALDLARADHLISLIAEHSIYLWSFIKELPMSDPFYQEIYNVSSNFIKNIKKFSKENRITFSPKEKAIIDLVVEGYSNEEIAEKLFISIQTLRTHLKSIFKKMGKGSREEIVRSYYSQRFFTSRY